MRWVKSLSSCRVSLKSFAFISFFALVSLFQTSQSYCENSFCKPKSYLFPLLWFNVNYIWVIVLSNFYSISVIKNINAISVCFPGPRPDELGGFVADGPNRTGSQFQHECCQVQKTHFSGNFHAKLFYVIEHSQWFVFIYCSEANFLQIY